MQSVRCQLLTVFLLFFFFFLPNLRGTWCSVFFGQFCDVVKSGYHPQKYLAIFGYKLNIEGKYFIHPCIQFYFILATYLTYVEKSSEFLKF
jgi:hypothetical protein